MQVRLTAALLGAIAALPVMGLAQPAPAVDVAVPQLPTTAATVESLAPVAWAIEQQHHADFNRDGRADVLLLLRRTAADGTMPLRMLMIALATATPRGYAPTEVNARLVPRDASGTLEDPMADGEITVRPGGFDLKLGMMPGAGSYLAATMRFRFRHEGGCFRLTGYDRSETHRGTLDTRDVSVNFLNGTVVHTTGNASSSAPQTARQRLTANPRRCLAGLGSGWTFDPLAP